jgi:2-dehydropantoate 2-reductase
MRALYDECIAVAQAEGISLPDNLWQSLMDISVNMAGQRSSTAQDLARGKKSEIEHLNGYVVRRGQELGIPAPVNRAVLCSVQLLELNGLKKSR